MTVLSGVEAMLQTVFMSDALVRVVVGWRTGTPTGESLEAAAALGDGWTQQGPAAYLERVTRHAGRVCALIRADVAFPECSTPALCEADYWHRIPQQDRARAEASHMAVRLIVTAALADLAKAPRGQAEATVDGWWGRGTDDAHEELQEEMCEYRHASSGA